MKNIFTQFFKRGKDKKDTIAIKYDTGTDNKNVRILIVDDAQINRFVLHKYITKYDSNIEVFEVPNGEEAIKEVKKQRFDIIFMDLKMPKMDGFRATEIIKNIQPQVDIIGVTGQIGKNSLNLSKKVGMSECLSKPIDFIAFSIFLSEKISKIRIQ